MKKLLILLGLTSVFSISASAVVFSDGTNVDDWRVYTDTAGEITTHDGVLNFSGEGKATGYRLDINKKYGASDAFISWYMKYSENFTIYVRLTTEKGVRYIVYTPRVDDRGISGEFIKIGLGDSKAVLDGKWHRVVRNLEEDLKKFDPDNNIISIDRFLVRGSGEIDKLQTGYYYDIVDINYEGYPYAEDAEDETIDGWSIYSGDSDKATITNVYDGDKNSRVIKLDGQGKATGYRFDSPDGIYLSGYDIRMCWDMKASEDYTVYLRIETEQDGRKYIAYTPRDENRGVSGNTVRIGLGKGSMDGKWHKYCVDPGMVLGEYFGYDKGYGTNSWIETMFFRGSISIDNIYDIADG